MSMTASMPGRRSKLLVAALLAALVGVAAAGLAGAGAERIEVVDESQDPTLEQLLDDHFQATFARSIIIRRAVIDGPVTGHLRIDLRLAEHEAFTPQAFRNLRLEVAETSSGEAIKPWRSAGAVETARDGRQTLALDLEHPRQAGHTLPRLRVTLELYVVREATRYAAFGPMEDLWMQELRVAGYGRPALRAGMYPDGGVGLAINAALQRLLRGDEPFAFYDGQGELITRSFGWQSSRSGIDPIRRAFRNVELPHDGYIELALYAEGRWIETTIELENIPLPAVEAEAPRQEDES